MLYLVCLIDTKKQCVKTIVCGLTGGCVWDYFLAGYGFLAGTSWSLSWLPDNLTVTIRLLEVLLPGQEIVPQIIPHNPLVGVFEPG